MTDQIPRLPNEKSSWLDDLKRPVWDFYLWCKTVDERIRATGAAITGGLADLAAEVADIVSSLTTVTECWSFFIPYVENDTIIILPKAPFGGTITNFITDADSGTCTARVRIEGVNAGAANNSVSTTEVDTAYTTDNEFDVNETVDVVISSNSSCQGMRGQITYTRSLL